MGNSVTQTKSLPVVNDFNFDKIKGKVDDLGQTATGGVWSKFKGHASKVMTRPGAKTQALGATGLILGGLAATGLLATITAALGVTCPPAAAGVLLVGGAILLGIGSYKVYQHSKKVVTQKAAEASLKTPENNQQKVGGNNPTVRTRDIALEFVKQTAENIIFGVPTILVQVIPEVREKLEACAEKYEAKERIKEGASIIFEQIDNLQNLQKNITSDIAKIQNEVNLQISDAKNEIANKPKEILENKINELNKQIEPYKEQLETIKTLQEAAKNPFEYLQDLKTSKDYLIQIRDIALEQANELDLGDNIKTKLQNAKDIKELIALENKIKEKAKQQNLSIDLQIQSNATKLEKHLEKKINNELKHLKSKLPDNIDELQQTLENTRAALDSLSDSKAELTNAAKTILQNSKDEAKKACQDQINNIKTRLKNEVKTIIAQQLKTHAEQTLKNFDISNIIKSLENQILKDIDSFNFENNIDLTNAINEIETKVNDFAQNVAEKFIQAGIQEVKQVGARKIETKMNQITDQFRNMGLSTE